MHCLMCRKTLEALDPLPLSRQSSVDGGGTVMAQPFTTAKPRSALSATSASAITKTSL
jgi:hypothetical protein